MAKQHIAHPLESVFDMEEGSTIDIENDYALVEGESNLPAEVEKDEEDIEVDRKIDAVYDAAMEAFETQTAYTEIIEPRYAARNAEVAANYLTIALNAAGARARVKSDRKKSGQFIPHGNKTTNNLIVADRNEILRMLDVDNDKKEIK